MTATRSRAGDGPGRPARGVDPRLQARRREVARKEGLRRLWMVAGLTLVATLALAAIGLARSSWLDIESVTVVGAQRADAQQIVTASGLQVGRPLVEVRPGQVADAVARVPWVATAEVGRGWRGAVTIEVTERQGLMVLPAGSRFVLVDRSGRQLEIVDAPPAGVLSVQGIEASGVPGQPVPELGLAAAILIEQLSPAVAQVTTGVAVEDGQLLLSLSTGGRANMGDERDLFDKMVALETVMAQVDLACVSVVDVRAPSAPTVSREVAPAGLRAAPEAGEQEPLAAPGGC